MNRFHSRPALRKREIFLKMTFTDYSPAPYLIVAKLPLLIRFLTCVLLIPITVAAFAIENFGSATFDEMLIDKFSQDTLRGLFALNSIHLLCALTVHEPPNIDHEGPKHEQRYR